MPSTNDVVFVDTNILIYAHDRDAGARWKSAQRALDELWKARTGRMSVQVLQEFFAVVTRKIKVPVDAATAREVIRNYSPWVTAPTDVETVLRASGLAEIARISFWDGMILAAAERSRASILYSEDLNDAQAIAGIRVVNPLV